MTSEPDSKAGRRPPTIELKATEIDNPAATGSGGPADAAAQEAPKAAPERPSGGPSRLISHAMSAIAGAVVVAAVVAGLWIAGVVPPSEAPTPPSAAAVATPPPSTAPDISARLDKIERAIKAQPDQQALTDRIAAVEAQTKSLAASLTAIDHRLDGIAATSENAAKEANAAQAAAQAADQAAKTASDNASQAGRAAVQNGDLDALTNRVATLESTVKSLAESAGHAVPSGNDQAARLTIAAEALRAAAERGTPYQAELAAVQSLGVQQSATAPLESFATSGVPNAAALAHELARLVPNLQRAAETSSGATTFLERLAANARHLVRITPVDAPPGNAPTAVIARIAADASRADIAAALTDIAALPESAKPLAAGWVETAKARQAALEASRQIAAEALAGLSRPASQ